MKSFVQLGGSVDDYCAVDAAEVGRWWGPVPTGEGRRTEQRELDIVALDHRRRPLAVGACKWTSQPVDLDELTALERLAPFVPGAGDNPCLYLFSRSGFTPRLRRRARDRASVRLRTPRDIYRRA